MKQNHLIRCAASVITIAILCVLFLTGVSRGQDVIYSQNFDAKSPGAWSNQTPVGYGTTFFSSTTSNPVGIRPYSRPKLLVTHVTNGGQLRSFPSAWNDTSGYETVTLRFMLYHDTASTAGEQVQVQVSTDNLQHWYNVGSAFPRYTGSNGWGECEVDLSGYVGQPKLYFAFLINGAGGSDVHIDNIEMSGTVTTPVLSPGHFTTGSRITVTGQHFGSQAGKVNLLPETPGAKPVKLKVSSWTDTMITCTIPKESLPVAHDAQIIRKVPKGAPVLTTENACVFSAPETDSITPTSGSHGDTIAIDGYYFGNKTPIVTLAGGGLSKAVKCKVVDSTMDPVSGDSTLHFIVPAKIPDGTYDLQLTNKVGTAISTGGFTVGI